MQPSPPLRALTHSLRCLPLEVVTLCVHALLCYEKGPLPAPVSGKCKLQVASSQYYPTPAASAAEHSCVRSSERSSRSDVSVGTGSARARETPRRRPPLSARHVLLCLLGAVAVAGALVHRPYTQSAPTRQPWIDAACPAPSLTSVPPLLLCSCPHPACACRACLHAAAPQLHPHPHCAVHVAALLLTGLAAPPASQQPRPRSLPTAPPHYSCRFASTVLAASPLPAYMR